MSVLGQHVRQAGPGVEVLVDALFAALRPGHAFGLEGHEHPFLDLDDHTVIEPGMIFSIEPGIYVPGLGGFRHSDTLLVTENGSERLSLYSRDLASLVIAAN